MTIKSKKAASVLGVVVLSMALALLICTSLLPKPMLHGDYPYYPDVESITSAADVIVVGEVVTARNVKKLMVDKTSYKRRIKPNQKSPCQYHKNQTIRAV